MSQQGCGDMIVSCFMNLFLSRMFWVVVVLFSCGFIAVLYVGPDTPAVDTIAETAPTPTLSTTEPTGGWDLSNRSINEDSALANTSINTDSTCILNIVAPLLLVLAFAFKR